MGSEQPARRLHMASAIVRDGDRLLLVKNHWGKIGRVWSIPGGRMEEGEAAADAVRREVQEETGLLVEPVDLAYVLDYHNIVYNLHFIYLVFQANAVGGQLAVPQQDEYVVDARWVPVSDVHRYVLWPEYQAPLLGYLKGTGCRYYRNPDAGLKAPLPDVP